MGRPRVSRKAAQAFSLHASARHTAARGKTGSARCPPDASALAESLWLGKLDAGAALEFEQHCQACSECARISVREREVIRMIRAALTEEPPELITTCPPVIFATRWPRFTDDVKSQFGGNQFQAERLSIPAGKEKLARGLLTFRWFHYRGIDQ